MTQTIFGSQFFNFDETDRGESFTMSRHFWIFWIITVPLTVIVLVIWVYFHPSNVTRWPVLKRTNHDKAYQMIDLSSK